jgi:cytoskeletal protein CcmA (bactofilin family)
VSIDGANARVKAAGAVVDVRGQVEGPVWVAGADVSVDAAVGDSIRAAAARVTVRGSATGDIMVAGALVDVDATAGGDMKAAGANVRIGPLTDIGGTLSAAGASVTFDGHVSGETKLAGAAVTLNGRADGDVSVHAERLVVGPQAVVAGNLFVRSLTEPEIDPGAEIAGEVVVERPGEWFDNMPEASALVVAAVFALSIFVVGLVFLIFARSTYGEAVDHVRFRPLSTLLYGIVSLLVLVVLAALLMATIVGFALGVALLMLLPMIFVLSQPVAAAGIVGWILGRTVPRLEVPRLILFLVLGALVIAFAGIIPFTGPWIVLVTFVFGLGGVLRALLWRFRTSRTSDQGFGSTPEREAVGPD